MTPMTAAEIAELRLDCDDAYGDPIRRSKVTRILDELEYLRLMLRTRRDDALALRCSVDQYLEGCK